MTRHTATIAATFAAALAISVSAAPAKISTEKQIAFNAAPQPVQSAQVHTLIGASFHSIHASF